METVTDFIFLDSKITGVCCHSAVAMMPSLWKESYGKQCIKKQRHHFADKGLYSQSYGFSYSHVEGDMSFGPHRRLNAQELMISNCDAGEDS